MNGFSSRTRTLTIIAQDPSVKDFKGKILKTRIEIPAEELDRGPRGYRVSVIDYDTSTGDFYRADSDYQNREARAIEYLDPFEADALAGRDEKLLKDPRFHCQNAYAIIMRTLARFEFALGRRVEWGFPGHQIHVAPHAFADANAFYAEKERALCFGYFKGAGVTGPNKKIIFSCLSHDVVAHETTHALLDGLRERYTDPSSPDQAAFHEGFSDIVALLSVFSLRDIVEALLPHLVGGSKKARKKEVKSITKKDLTKVNLSRSVLLGLAEEMGDELSGFRGSSLRRSVELKPIRSKSKTNGYLDDPEFEEPHRRGEILVAAVMNTFLDIWLTRLANYTKERGPNDRIDSTLIVDEGAEAAEHLLTMMIRALDYAPPTDIRFPDFLSAVLTADADIVLLDFLRLRAVYAGAQKVRLEWEHRLKNARALRNPRESSRRKPTRLDPLREPVREALIELGPTARTKQIIRWIQRYRPQVAQLYRNVNTFRRYVDLILEDLRQP